MAWLQKIPQINDAIQYYSTGMHKTLLIVGLGNPGKEYDLTRHNVGFACIDHFVAKTDGMEPWIAKKSLKCLMSSGLVGTTRVIAMKPTTFMNLSGQAVQAVSSFYKLAPSQMVIVHDELDVDFGQIRLRVGGSSAGHNGIKSVTEQLGTEDYGRVRVGIGPKKPARIKSEDFVLKKFATNEEEQLPNLLQEASAILSEYSYSGQLPQDTRHFLI